MTNYYQHVDGGIYLFLCLSRSTVDLSTWASYKHVWPFEQSFYHRPVAEWTDGRFKQLDVVEVALLTQEDPAVARERIAAARDARRALKAADESK